MTGKRLARGFSMNFREREKDTVRHVAAIAAVCLVASLASPLQAARLTVGTATASAGGTASIRVSFTAEGTSVSILQVDLLASSPLSYASAAAGSAATAAGKQVGASAISGGVRLLVYGLNQNVLGDGDVASVTYTVASSAGAGTYTVSAQSASAADPQGNAVTLSATSGSVSVSGGGPATASWILPSSARATGAGGAFYTTDLTVANTGTSDASFTLKFLGNNADGRSGPEKTFSLSAGRSTTFADVLGSVFSVSSGFGAIQVKGSVASLAVMGQTATPGSGGTFGQSVPGMGSAALISSTPRAIPAIREDGSFRTNLILANAGESQIDVNVTLLSEVGATLATKRYTLPPLGMTQVTRVVRDLGYPGDLSGGRLLLSSATGGIFAAYASVIDNITNDPRTLLPQ